MNSIDEESILHNGVVLPSPRTILEQDVQHHTAVIKKHKVLLEDILSTEATLENAIKRHKQPYETLNIRKLIQKQLSYDKYQNLKQDLQTLENNINSLNQDVGQDMERLN